MNKIKFNNFNFFFFLRTFPYNSIFPVLRFSRDVEDTEKVQLKKIQA